MHSRTLQNAGAPLTVEGIRLLNTDIESRVADFLKNELGIAKLDNVVVIDGGRQSIGIVLPLIISITYCVFLLGLFFTFVKKQKRVWAIVAIVCGWLALLPAIISREPRYKSPLPAQETNTTAIKYQTEQKAGAYAHEKGAASVASESQTSAATNNSAPRTAPNRPAMREL